MARQNSIALLMAIKSHCNATLFCSTCLVLDELLDPLNLVMAYCTLSLIISFIYPPRSPSLTSFSSGTLANPFTSPLYISRAVLSTVDQSALSLNLMWSMNSLQVKTFPLTSCLVPKKKI